MHRQTYRALHSPESQRAASWGLPCVGLVTTSIVCAVLTVLNFREWKSSEDLASFVLQQRSTIAIFVQVISHVLGWMQVQVLSYVVMSSFRVSLRMRAFSLDTIRYIDALSRQAVAWRARWLYGLSSLLFVAFSLIPGALWSGAITPILAEQQTRRTLHIPTFQEQNLSAMWEVGNSGAWTDGFWVTNKGLFTFDLSIQSVRGALLGAAITASNSTRPGSFRAKLDETGYHYTSRSYGAGAAAGLIDIPDTLEPQWYSYYEVALRSGVACTRNDSSAFGILLADTGGEDTTTNALTLFSATGSVANGLLVPTWLQAAPIPQDIFIWGFKYADRKTYISLAVNASTAKDPWSFHQFDKVQCEVNYEARNVSVFVNATARTILTADIGPVTWPDYADIVLDNMSTPFWLYSADDSFNSGSGLGHSIVVNINQLRTATGDHSNATLYQGLADYIESLYDNGLIMLSAARLIGVQKTMPVEAIVGVTAIRYGKPIYIYAVLAVNAVVLLGFAIEALRTRAWKDISGLELSDIGSVILSAAEGGKTLAEKARNTPAEKMGHIRIQLEKTGWSAREAIVLQKSVASMDKSESQVQLVQLSSSA